MRTINRAKSLLKSESGAAYVNIIITLMVVLLIASMVWGFYGTSNNGRTAVDTTTNALTYVSTDPAVTRIMTVLQAKAKVTGGVAEKTDVTDELASADLTELFWRAMRMNNLVTRDGEKYVISTEGGAMLYGISNLDIRVYLQPTGNASVEARYKLDLPMTWFGIRVHFKPDIHRTVTMLG